MAQGTEVRSNVQYAHEEVKPVAAQKPVLHDGFFVLIFLHKVLGESRTLMTLRSMDFEFI